MSYVTIPGGLWIPNLPPMGAAAPAYTSFLIDATAEKVAFVFRAPKTGTLDKFEFRLGAVAQAPASGLTCSFQDVSGANGDPDGTQDQFRTVTAGLTANAWVAPGLITSDGTDGGVKRSVTAGDLLCAVIEFASFGAGDSLNIVALGTNTSTAFGQAYLDHFTAAWAKSAAVGAVLALKYNDGTYSHIGPDVYAASALTGTAFNTGSTPDERGLIFQFPVALKVGGAWVRYLTAAAGRDFSVILYDANGATALETISIDADVSTSTASPITTFVRFTQERALLANTDYRLTTRPDTANSNTAYDFDVNAAAIMDSFPGGQNFRHTQRTDAGSWTNTATKRPWMGLLVTAIEAGAGRLVNGGLVGV